MDPVDRPCAAAIPGARSSRALRCCSSWLHRRSGCASACRVRVSSTRDVPAATATTSSSSPSGPEPLPRCSSPRRPGQRNEVAELAAVRPERRGCPRRGRARRERPHRGTRDTGTPRSTRPRPPRWWSGSATPLPGGTRCRRRWARSAEPRPHRGPHRQGPARDRTHHGGCVRAAAGGVPQSGDRA